jgi:hypothetical protein
LWGNGHALLGDGGISFECFNSRGRSRKVLVESVKAESLGHIRDDLRFEAQVRRCGGLRIGGRVSLFASQSLMRVEVTLQNPARAKHAGGLWDLGDAGSVLLQGWRMVVDLSALRPGSVEWVETAPDTRQMVAAFPWRICQYSSGGENWNSRNHVNRHNTVPLRMRGYRTNQTGGHHEGLRASPVVTVKGAASAVTCALTEFWQKFPSAVSCDGQKLFVEFWPDDFGDLHELQAGEHCTRVVWLRFDDADQAGPTDLAWVHEPLVPTIDPAWLAASNAIPWFPEPSAARRPELQVVLNEALCSPRNLLAKREAIDEYGWRNFGDVWADHEEAYYDGPKPIISHYNNQYDLLYGLLIQYLLTGDQRWWQLADPLARHLMDIDVYHTTRDKSAYSGGLFWHTAHYRDAGTSSHRTYSREMNGPSGGPANEHAYTAGLLLYHYLTGDTRAKNTVLRLADWIIGMDDGSQHVLGLLSHAPTGRASSTAHTDYHGPGRGAGNAIGVMLDAWLATGEGRYIDFAESLICRTVHPGDDIDSRDLNNFERRWSYTVYLQQLARYVLLTEGIARHHQMREYAVASLVHYATWMADHDRFYLDYPDQLEYPTETWAAQELRKGNVLFAASQYCDGELSARFRRRGKSMMDRAWQSLLTFGSRSYTRPLALVLQQGFIETYFSSERPIAVPPLRSSSTHADPPSGFTTQRAEIRNCMKSPARLARAAVHAIQPTRWNAIVRRTWACELLRRCINSIR